MSKAKDTSAALVRRYRQAIARVYRDVKGSDGLPTSQILKAEKELGHRLPLSLRAYYILAGADEKLNRSCNRLLKPGNIQVTGRYAVFYEENQNVAEWAFKTDDRRDDPVVFGNNGDLDNEKHWYKETDKLSNFIEAQIYWQAPAPFCGSIETISKSTIIALNHSYTQLLVLHKRHEVFGLDDIAISFFKRPNSIHILARTRDAIEQCGSLLKTKVKIYENDYDY